jgi:hypothetical protein
VNDELRQIIRAEAEAAQAGGRMLEIAPELALRCLDWLVEAQARVAALDAEAAALRDVLVALVDGEDAGLDDGGFCAYCATEPSEELHTRDCPIRRGREVLSGNAGAALLAELEAARGRPNRAKNA